MHRHAKIYTIFEGASEIQRLAIPRAISGLQIGWRPAPRDSRRSEVLAGGDFAVLQHGKTTKQWDSRKRGHRGSPLALLQAGEGAVWVTERAIQILGGNSYTREYPGNSTMEGLRADASLRAAPPAQDVRGRRRRPRDTPS